MVSADVDAAALTLSVAARRLFALVIGDASGGGSTAAAEAAHPVLQLLEPLLAWLHESLNAVLDAVAGKHKRRAVLSVLSMLQFSSDTHYVHHADIVASCLIKCCLDKCFMSTCAERGEVPPAVSDWCEASRAALSSLITRALAGGLERAQPSVPDAEQPTANGAEHMRSPAADDVVPHACLIAQQLLAPATGGQRLAHAVAAEAYASAIGDVLRTAADGMQRKNPYHEILAGDLRSLQVPNHLHDDSLR